MPRHEHVLDHHGVAAGPAKADDMPDIVDSVLATRDQKASEVDWPAVLDDRAAEERPRGVVATRRPVPGPTDEVAVVDEARLDLVVATRTRLRPQPLRLH